MPRTKSAIPSYRQHRASGQAVVTLNGTDVYLGKFNSPESKAKYNQVLAEWLARGRRLPAKDDTLVKELIAGYHAHCVATKRDVEVEKVRLALRPVRELFGELRTAELSSESYEALRIKLVESGLGIATIRYRLGVIRRTIAWGIAHKMIPDRLLLHDIKALEESEPLRTGQPGIKAPKVVQPVSDEHIAAVLPCLTPTVRAMVELQVVTGMRPGEVWRMTMGQIDRTGDPWIYRPSRHKNLSRGKDRVIPLGPRAREILAPWLRADPDAILFSPRESAEHADTHRRHRSQATEAERTYWREWARRNRQKKRLPKRRNREMYSRETYNNAIRRGCQKAGIPAFGANRLRHAFATRVRREFGLEAAQVSLGHSKADVTQIYAEKNLALAIDVARKIG